MKIVLRPKTVLSTLALATVTLSLSLTPGIAFAAVPRFSSAQTTAAATWQAPRLTKLVTEALHQTTLGISYSYGGGHGSRPAPLNSHVDCSGFVREMYGYAFGVDIGSGSGDSMIRTSGKFTRTSHPVPGDVALFGNSGRAPAYHSGIYVGLIAGHPAIAASPSTGSNIKIQQWSNRYWSGDLMGYWHFNGATAADSGSAARPRMAGSFDAASGIKGGVSVSGWAVDPQRSASATTVGVTVDNRSVGTVGTATDRPDVNSALGTSGNHGFRASVPSAPGRHTVCLTARPAGSSTAAVGLGCKVVIAPGPTRGVLDQATGGARHLEIRGWAYDPNVASAAAAVRVTLDGRAVTDIRTSGARPDVNRVFHIGGPHGFAGRLAAGPGRHTVCVTVLPVSAESYVSNLGCKAVVVTK